MIQSAFGKELANARGSMAEKKEKATKKGKNDKKGGRGGQKRRENTEEPGRAARGRARRPGEGKNVSAIPGLGLSGKPETGRMRERVGTRQARRS